MHLNVEFGLANYTSDAAAINIYPFKFLFIFVEPSWICDTRVVALTNKLQLIHYLRWPPVVALRKFLTALIHLLFLLQTRLRRGFKRARFDVNEGTPN